MSDAPIRLATVEDAMTIARFRLALLTEPHATPSEPYEKHVSEWSTLFARWLREGTLRYWLAEENDTAVGGAGVLVRPIFPHPTRIRALEGRLQNFYVVPARRNAGLGSRLLAEIFAWLRSQHINRVVVHPSKAAGNWYARNGFEPLDEMILDLR